MCRLTGRVYSGGPINNRPHQCALDGCLAALNPLPSCCVVRIVLQEIESLWPESVLHKCVREMSLISRF
jgi:hypothetical protein